MTDPDPHLRAALDTAYAAGVRPVVTDGRVTGYTGPRLAILAWFEAVRLWAPRPPVPPDPARQARTAHRQAVERWRRNQKKGR